jgi:hypothetical protein
LADLILDASLFASISVLIRQLPCLKFGRWIALSIDAPRKIFETNIRITPRVRRRSAARTNIRDGVMTSAVFDEASSAARLVATFEAMQGTRAWGVQKAAVAPLLAAILHYSR